MQSGVASIATDNRFDATADTGPLRHKFLVGVDYRQVRNDADYGFDYGTATIDAYAPTYPPLATPAYGYPTRYNHQTIDQTGVYFQDQIKFGQLFLLGGGRYDWVDSRYPRRVFSDQYADDHEQPEREQVHLSCRPDVCDR